MSERFIPYARQQVTPSDVEAVAEVLASDYLTTGPAVTRFEQALAAAGAARWAVALSSGTAALHAAYFAAGLGSGDEIITSPLTFAATANAGRFLGATVRFVDVEPDTGNLDAALLEEAVGGRTRLLAPVDYAGHPAEYDRLVPFARAHGLGLVSDSAHSLGGTYHGRPVGSLVDLTVTSFHPVKAITTAEGGAVLGDDDQMRERVSRFRDHGIERRPAGSAGEGPWYYEMHDLGYNYRLSDVHSALGSSQLGRLGANLARRRWIVARYAEAFADLPQLALPFERPGVESGWHLYVVRVSGEVVRRRPFFERLRRLGLGVQVHYIPVYWHPYYQELGYRRGECPRAEDFYSRCVSIPLYPAMSDEDVELTIERVRCAVADTL
jgi:UDP-4-amino-4,6-dideoxy-N-acetyl-beta-L-altrosamine transaminase